MPVRKEGVVELDVGAAARPADQEPVGPQRKRHRSRLRGSLRQNRPDRLRDVHAIHEIGLMADRGNRFGLQRVAESEPPRPEDENRVLMQDGTNAPDKRAIHTLEVVQVPLKAPLPFSAANLGMGARDRRVVGQLDIARGATNREPLASQSDILPLFQRSVIEHGQDRHGRPQTRSEILVVFGGIFLLADATERIRLRHPLHDPADRRKLLDDRRQGGGTRVLIFDVIRHASPPFAVAQCSGWSSATTTADYSTPPLWC